MPTSPDPGAPPARIADRRCLVLLAAGLIVAAGLAAYAGSFRGPFVYDDAYTIVDNPSIRHLTALGRVLAAPAEAMTAQGRPVLNLSFAVNYAFGGTDVAGYHALNLAIHLLAGLALLGVVRRTLLMPSMRARYGSASLPLALAVALLWTVHPLQTEAVTYVSQRAESLMGLFYLLTLYCFIRGAIGGPLAPSGAGRGDEPGRGIARLWPWGTAGTAPLWFLGSWLACLLGMGTKEVIVSAPLTVFLYDAAFIAGSPAEAWRRRRTVFLLLAATWIPLAWLVASGGGNRAGTAGFGTGISWPAYALTQFVAVPHYLRLAFWPHPLVFDYGAFRVTHPASILPGAALVIGLGLASLAAWRRRPGLGFLGYAFYAILAPTSLVPGATQMIAEHRMYLALAAVAALAVAGLYPVLGRRGSLAVWLAAAGVLGWLTARRNRDYRSEESIWADTVRKRPGDAIAHYNLGHALAAEPGREDEAIRQFREAVRIEPRYADAHDSLGLALERRPGGLGEAIAQFREALRLDPGDPKTLNNLGDLLAGLPGGYAEGVADLRAALARGRLYEEIHYNLARALARDPSALPEAAAEYRRALALRPGDAAAHEELGSVLAKMPGREEEALGQFREAVALEPDSAEAHNDLGALLAGGPGALTEAIAQFQEAVRLKPDYLEARFNLGVMLLARPGGEREAEAQFEEVLRLKPGFGPALDMLARIREGRTRGP